MKNKVSIIQCHDYEKDNITRAFDEMVAQLGDDIFAKKGEQVLVKLNLLRPAKPEEAVTTHPALLWELLSRLKDIGATALVGDSPGGIVNDSHLKRCYQLCGIDKVCAHFGARLISFENEHEKRPCKNGLIREYNLPKIMNQSDRIIGIGRLKNHQYMAMTGAVKLHYGFVPGLAKAAFHMQLPDHEEFARMLVELCGVVNPTFSILDAIVAMEGDGPGSGTPREVGALLASYSPYAIDFVAARLIGHNDPLDIPTNKLAYKLGFVDPAKISTDEGLLARLKVDDFERIPWGLRDILPHPIFRILRRFSMARPFLLPKICISCQACKEACPVSAITMVKNKPHFDLSRCIRCYCCQEMCPVSAIKVRPNWISRTLSSVFYRSYPPKIMDFLYFINHNLNKLLGLFRSKRKK